MRLRKLNKKHLFWSGAVYRIIVITINALFFKIGVKQALANYGPLGASLIWNSINITLYYLYHYCFLKLFKMGEENGK